MPDFPASSEPPSVSAGQGRYSGFTSAFAALSAILLIAAVFGGGGVRYALSNLLVQLAALFAMAVYRENALSFWKHAPVSLRIGVSLVILLPLAQLVPLPPVIWEGAPGRDLVAQALALTGEHGWRPLSVDPIRTLVAATGLIVPVAVLAIGWGLPRHKIYWLGWVVVLLGVLQLTIGIPQALSQGANGSLYEVASQQGALRGFFANRNSAGLFFVIALIFLISLPSPIQHKAVPPAKAMIALLFITAILLTRSRSALVLTAIPLALAIGHLVSFWRAQSTKRQPGRSRAETVRLAIFGVLIAALAMAMLALAPGRIGDTLDRFEARTDARAFIWEDAVFSAKRYAPIGAGMGTFDEVFQIDESLEHMTERRAGRAHNDYLELAIEAGYPGLALLFAWMALIVWWTWRGRKSEYRQVVWGSSAALLAISIQSVVDYPLRNQAMLATACVALLLLARYSAVQRGTQ